MYAEASEQTREHARQLLFDGIFSPTAFIPPGDSVHRLLKRCYCLFQLISHFRECGSIRCLCLSGEQAMRVRCACVTTKFQCNCQNVWQTSAQRSGYFVYPRVLAESVDIQPASQSDTFPNVSILFHINLFCALLAPVLQSFFTIGMPHRLCLVFCIITYLCRFGDFSFLYISDIELALVEQAHESCRLLKCN